MEKGKEASWFSFPLIKVCTILNSHRHCPRPLCVCLRVQICSDMNKPNGQHVLIAQAAACLDFVRDLPCRKVPGVGKVTEALLSRVVTRGDTEASERPVTCGDLYRNRALIVGLFSPSHAEVRTSLSQPQMCTHIPTLCVFTFSVPAARYRV